MSKSAWSEQACTTINTNLSTLSALSAGPTRDIYPAFVLHIWTVKQNANINQNRLPPHKVTFRVLIFLSEQQQYLYQLYASNMHKSSMAAFEERRAFRDSSCSDLHSAPCSKFFISLKTHNTAPGRKWGCTYVGASIPRFYKNHAQRDDQSCVFEAPGSSLHRDTGHYEVSLSCPQCLQVHVGMSSASLLTVILPTHTTSLTDPVVK